MKIQSIRKHDSLEFTNSMIYEFAYKNDFFSINKSKKIYLSQNYLDRYFI